MRYKRGSKMKKLYAAGICFLAVFCFGITYHTLNAEAKENISQGRFGDVQNKGDLITGETNPPDMTNVTLAQTNITLYLVPSYSYGKSVYYDNVEFDVAVNSPVILDEDMDDIYFTCKSSNKNVRVSAELSNNNLHFSLYADKKCDTNLTISIADKKFELHISVKPVKISANSLLLPKGKTKKLKISGCKDVITWTSSNKKIATVSKTGVVKGKKYGNAVITAKIGSKYIGCAVSVTTQALKKVCERATFIGNNWKYSQAKRTKSGYYDCSSLVWRAYMERAGFNFGNSSYPGTSATESAWCRDNKRMIKGGYSYKKVKKMQINPGDLVFKSTNLGDPYRTTYHVEMFTGYLCLGYDSKGKANVTSLWASRDPGYSAAEGSLLARPLKYK